MRQLRGFPASAQPGIDGANDGNENPSTPENSFSFWSTYQLFPYLTIGGGANYVDSRYGDAANTIQVSSYWRYDAMANLKVSKSLELQLNVQNLTDKRYFDQVFTTHVAPGRTVLLATNFPLLRMLQRRQGPPVGLCVSAGRWGKGWVKPVYCKLLLNGVVSHS